MATQQQLAPTSDENSESSKQDDAVFEFTPDIEYQEACNGVFSLTINNIQELWDASQYDDPAHPCLEFVYKRIPIKLGSHSDIDNQWRAREIIIGNVSNDGKIFIKVPIYLNEYNITFKIKALNTKTNEWMLPSKLNTINIKSYLINNNFKINDLVVFHPDNQTYHTIPGAITKILDDNMFEIKYLKFDPKKGLPDDDINAYVPSSAEIEQSKIFFSGIDDQYLITLIDPEDMEHNVLIKRNDSKSIDIYNMIFECFSCISQSSALDIHGYNEMLVHWESMNRFVTKNIFDFLFEPHFNYRVNCLVNGQNDGCLRIGNVRQKDIRNTYSMLINNIGNIKHINNDAFVESLYQCDWCGTELREWNYSFSCHASYLDRHDICLTCVNTIIRLNVELKQLLYPILQNELINDCIQCIVDYVIGGVKFYQFDIDDDMDVIIETCMIKKRTINEMNDLGDVIFTPNKKRRKLNQPCTNKQ